jgi:hypothetical protein
MNLEQNHFAALNARSNDESRETTDELWKPMDDPKFEERWEGANPAEPWIFLPAQFPHNMQFLHISLTLPANSNRRSSFFATGLL